MSKILQKNFKEFEKKLGWECESLYLCTPQEKREISSLKDKDQFKEYQGFGIRFYRADKN